MTPLEMKAIVLALAVVKQLLIDVTPEVYADIEATAHGHLYGAMKEERYCMEQVADIFSLPVDKLPLLFSSGF